MNFARLTAIIHLIYALSISLSYALGGVIGLTMVTLIYNASYQASVNKSSWLVKITYHLLFRYVGFWILFILHSRIELFSPLEWLIVFIVTSVAYFGHAFMVLSTFSPKIGYEIQLAIMIQLIICSCIFTHFLC